MYADQSSTEWLLRLSLVGAGFMSRCTLDVAGAGNPTFRAMSARIFGIDQEQAASMSKVVGREEV